MREYKQNPVACNIIQSPCFLSSSDYEAFKEAAEQFQPYIKFFATFEKSVSNKQTNKTDIVIIILERPVFVASGGQGADSEAERGGFLRALHGGAGHRPRQASL